MAGDSTNLDRILSLLAIFLSPFFALMLSRIFNARELKQKERIADSGEDVSIFSAHIQAFRLRCEQLERAERAKEEEIGELRVLLGEAESRAEELDAQNGRLLRENYRLRSELDDRGKGRKST